MSQYERYGDYIVNRKDPLGNGKFGIVWRGYRIIQSSSNDHFLEPVAIKQSAYDQQNIQEINTLQILNHPNIIRYIDYKISGQNLFMVMELCEGGTLQDLLMTFTQENYTEQVLYYYVQVVKGISFMYNKNILHRDIKPSNILIKDNKIKIADFGTSKLKQDNQMIRTLVGTPLFASPQILELFIGQEQSYTEKSDIWSLGLILYFMFHFQKGHETSLQRLRESLPWKGKNSIEVLQNIKSKPLQFRSDRMPQQIREIVTKMLTVDVESRMSFKQFFDIDLFREKKGQNLIAQNMNQSTVVLQLSRSLTDQKYQLTLINEYTQQPQLLKRQTIDFELLKLLQLRDSEDYEQKEASDAVKFYEMIKQEAQLSQSPEIYVDLIFELDCQIYQVTLLRRCLVKRLTTSQRGIKSNQLKSNIVDDMFEEEEPQDENGLHLFRKCQSIREKHFAFTKRFDGIDQNMRSKLEQLFSNSNLAEKENLLIKIISPHEFLGPEIKLILKKKKPLFEGKNQPVNASMSKMEIYLCYDLLNVLAFQYCWKMRSQQKRKAISPDFFEAYREERCKINIWQIIHRIEASLKCIKM